MPFWYGPQTHQEAPGSSIAIQHEITRQSPRMRQDELCAGAISGAHVLGPDLHHLLAPAPTALAPAGRAATMSPTAQVSSEVHASPFPLVLGAVRDASSRL